MLKASHASDLYGFVSYYGLSQAIRGEVLSRREPIPPFRMKRLTPAVYWNNQKGGVDVISRYLRTLARSNMSEHPVVSIIALLLSMQINNTAVAYRLHVARGTQVLPGLEDVEVSHGQGYAALRHKVTQCTTFGSFARELAREWFERYSKENGGLPDENGDNESGRIKPLFTRNASERYNIGTHKARRLNRIIAHKKVSGPSTYCVVCSWSLRGRKTERSRLSERAQGKYSGVERVGGLYALRVGYIGTRRTPEREEDLLLVRNRPLIVFYVVLGSAIHRTRKQFSFIVG